MVKKLSRAQKPWRWGFELADMSPNSAEGQCRATDVNRAEPGQQARRCVSAQGPVRRQRWPNGSAVPRSSCLAVVASQKAAKTFRTLDIAEGTPYLLAGDEDPIAHSLVITFGVKMGQEFTDRISQRGLAEEDHPIQTFLFKRAVESFQIGVQIGASRRQKQRLDAVALLDGPEGRREFAVPVHEQVTPALEEVVFDVGQVPGDLDHPWVVGIGGATCPSGGRVKSFCGGLVVISAGRGG